MSDLIFGLMINVLSLVIHLWSFSLRDEKFYRRILFPGVILLHELSFVGLPVMVAAVMASHFADVNLLPFLVFGALGVVALVVVAFIELRHGFLMSEGIQADSDMWVILYPSEKSPVPDQHIAFNCTKLRNADSLRIAFERKDVTNIVINRDLYKLRRFLKLTKNLKAGVKSPDDEAEVWV